MRCFRCGNRVGENICKCGFDLQNDSFICIGDSKKQVSYLKRSLQHMIMEREEAADRINMVENSFMSQHEKRAEQGDCFQTGLEYFKSGNYEEAIRWWEMSADQGEISSEMIFYIGHMYEKGLGVVADSDEAIRWYNKAAEKGNKEARDRLLKFPLTKQEENQVLSKPSASNHQEPGVKPSEKDKSGSKIKSYDEYIKLLENEVIQNGGKELSDAQITRFINNYNLSADRGILASDVRMDVGTIRTKLVKKVENYSQYIMLLINAVTKNGNRELSDLQIEKFIRENHLDSDWKIGCIDVMTDMQKILDGMNKFRS